MLRGRRKLVIPMLYKGLKSFKEGLAAADMVNKLKEQGILCYAIASNRVRFVIHLDITTDMVNKTIEIISTL